MKICKQCGRNLDESCFRPTKSRSRGIYTPSSTGCSTMCRECESLNNRAHAALKRNDEAAIVALKQHYEMLDRMGYPPVSAAARRLLGLEPLNSGRETNKLMASLSLREHVMKIRDRLYSSVEEADAEHRRLETQLRDAGLYEEATNLLDDWYMED